MASGDERNPAAWWPAERSRIDTRAIDGMRGLAVMHVIVGHCGLWTDWRDLWSQDFRGEVLRRDGCETGHLALIGGGSMGLFYIISGFVMALGYAQTLVRVPSGGGACGPTVCCPACDQFCCSALRCCIALPRAEEALPDFKAWHFLRKRFARLAPMYFLTNVIALVFLFERDVGGAGTGEDAGIGLIIFCIMSALGLTSWFGLAPPNGVTWTISTMMFFYLCFPALVPRLQRIPPPKLRCFALGLYVLQLVLMAPLPILAGYTGGSKGVGAFMLLDDGAAFAARMFPSSRLPVFVMGVCAGLQRMHAEAARKEGRQEPEQKSPCCPFVASCAGCACLEPATGLPLFWVATCLAASSTIFACRALFYVRWVVEWLLPILFYDWVVAATDPAQQSSPVVRFLASGPMTWLGQVSMCVYMVHFLVVLAIVELRGEGKFDENPLWTTPVVVVVSLVVGWGAHRYFETPMARLLRPKQGEGHDAASASRTSGAAAGQPVGTQVSASSELVGSPTAVAPAKLGAPRRPD